MKRIEFALLLLGLVLFSCQKKEISITSPSEGLHATIYTDSLGLQLDLARSDQQVVTVDLGKFALKEGVLGNTYQIEEVKYASKDETWKPVYGDRDSIRNRYNEAELLLKDGASGRLVTLICRLYDEGVAFSYLFDKTSFDGVGVEKELTAFNFNGDHQAWVANRAQALYEKKRISEIDKVSERPLVIRQDEQTYLALGEANLVDYARMQFIRHPEKENAIQTTIDGPVDLNIAGFKTPWRYVMVADSPGQLLENNYLALNLSEPNKIEDISWIKPGKIIREVTLTTAGGMACVDFAVKHNLQYVEYDAGWYGHEYDNASDATTITVDPKRSPGPLDLQKVIDYAKQKGIGIILYVNRRALGKQLDELLPLYKSWGVAGVKYGFVHVGSQEWTSWLHEAVRKAADHQLMVDIHDEYRPTGYSRTYPNLMTQEGIRGDEARPSTEQSLITAFTRMVAGAGDNTNCYFDPRVPELFAGKAGQMAKAIILYSPWQFVYWYDRPEESPRKKGGAGNSKRIIAEGKDLKFFDAVPTVWDETKVLEGAIGEYATIARRSGDTWFIGSLTANEKRTVELSLDFLESDAEYRAVLYYQDEEARQSNEVNIKQLELTPESTITRELAANSGFALILRKYQTDDELGLHSEGGPWAFYPDSEENDSLSNALLIGDSVMNGYHQPAMDSLREYANVDYWLTPKHLNSKHLLDDLKKVVKYRKYDVIHFNIGLHGWAEGRILPGEYEPLLEKYVKTIKENAPQAKLIWASTTPVTEEGEAILNKEINPIIVKRNIKAARVMKENNVLVNDLYSLVVNKLDLGKPDRFHWKREGYQLIGNACANEVIKALDAE